MKTASRLNILFLLLFLMVSCYPGKKIPASSGDVKTLSDTVRLREGSLIYALPLTVFTVKIELEKTTEIPGPYAKYAGDLLGMNEVILNRNEHWSVKSISVDSHQEVDPSEYYVIEASGSFQTNALALRSEGLILDLNPAIDSKGMDLVKGREMNLNHFVPSDLGSDEYYLAQTDTAFRRVKVDSSFIRIPYIVEKKKKLTNDQLAERAARRLMELRDGKVMILTGEANVYPQNNAAIDELNSMEQEYAELFAGKTFKETYTLSYQVIPRKDQTVNSFTLLTFSEKSGPVGSEYASGKPIMVEIVPEQKTKDLTVITRAQPEPEAKKTDKLYYRIPDVAGLKVLLGNETIYTSRRLIYQFGEIMQLPSNYVIGK